MVADSVEFLRANGRQVLFDAEHFFDGYRSNPEFALRVLEGAAQAGASHLVLCDTNGGTLPHDVERVVARGRRLLRRRRRRRRPPPRRRRHRRRQRAGRRARRRHPGAGDDQRVRRAHGELQPHGDHPEPHAEDGDRDHPARPARAPHAGRPPRGRAREHGAQCAGRVRGLVGVRAQGRHPRQRDRPQARRVRARPPELVGNRTHVVVSELAGAVNLAMKAKELGIELDGPQLSEMVDTLKQLEHEGYHFEVADGSLELLMRHATGWRQDWFHVEEWEVIVEDARDDERLSTTGDRARPRRRRRLPRDRDGQRPRERARRRPAQGHREPVPGARSDPPHRLQGARARHAQGHRRRDPGARRQHRRRGDVDDDRGGREHHRGVVAGARGLARVRVAPRPAARQAIRPCPPTRSSPSASRTSHARSRTSRRA